MKHVYTLILIFFACHSTILLGQNALSFDGQGDYVTASNASGLIASQNMSLSFWVNPTNPSPGFPNFDGFAGFRNNSNADFYILHLNTNSVEARFRNSSGNNFDIVYNGVNINTWNHFVLTYDGTTLTLYHDGVSVGTQPANGFITSSSEALYMGNLQFQTTNFYLNGQLDDVALWSKNLSSSEVMNLYNACSVETTLNGLALLYEFNQGVGGGNNTNITNAMPSVGNINGVFNGLALNGATSNFVSYSKNSFATINPIICGGTYTAPSGATYSMSGTYQDILTGAGVSGCDSVITINLTVASPSTSSISPSACETYTSPTGNIFTTSGTYTDTLTSYLGCDSLLTINLTIVAPSTASISPSACVTYTSPSGNVLTASGTYMDTLTNYLGCDSLITINLTINPLPDVMVTEDSTSLTANQAGATYQWLDCDNGNAPITNETNATFTPSLNGNYAVEVTLNDCTDVSDCIAFAPVSSNEIFITPIKVFPNPTVGQFQLDLGQFDTDISINITNTVGQLVQSHYFENHQFITLTLDQPNGVYFINVISDNKKAVLKVFKQ